MVFAFSEAFGPTTSSSGSVEKQIGSDLLCQPGSYHIKKIRIGKGCVTGVEQYTGIVYLKVKGTDGTFEYAYGRGLSSATDTGNVTQAEEIKCGIPVKGGSNVQVFVKDVVDCPGVTVSLEFHNGLGRKIQSYAVQGSVTVAVTEESMGTVVMTDAGRIIEARFVGTGNVDAKSGTAIFKIVVPGLSGPYHWAVGNGQAGDVSGAKAPADIIDISGGIPVGKNVTVDLRVVSTDVLMTPAASIQVA